MAFSQWECVILIHGRSLLIYVRIHENLHSNFHDFFQGLFWGDSCSNWNEWDQIFTWDQTLIWDGISSRWYDNHVRPGFYLQLNCYLLWEFNRISSSISENKVLLENRTFTGNGFSSGRTDHSETKFLLEFELLLVTGFFLEGMGWYICMAV